ncbi:MAG: hypothetical protein ACE15C_19965 [Phycisphaerae bacterium]
MIRTIAVLSCVAMLAGAAASQVSVQPASAPATGPASGPASAPAGRPWITLFANEQWYKQQAGKEEVFTGKLEAVPNAGGPSTRMRTSFYKLGDRTVYTGARKVKALDDLVGKKVEMRGKGVSMNLEGQALSEIWPAAVRAAE